jgi:cytochrome P450
VLNSGVLNRVRTPVHWAVAHGLPRAVMRTAARRGDLQGRLVLTGADQDEAELWSVIEEVRASGPLHRAGLANMTADHAVVKEVLTSRDFVTGLPEPTRGPLRKLLVWSTPDVMHPVRPPSLLVTEPPDHTRYRKLVTRVFTGRAVEQLRGRTEQIARGLLDSLDPARPVDLVAAYCSQLPVTVISEVLGVPEADRPRVLELGSAAAASLDLGLSWHEFRTVDRALREFDAWLTHHLDELRRNPGQDLMSQLLQAQEDGVGLSEEELRATAGLVLVAGFETTVNLLGNGVRLLHENPDQLKRLQREPELWPNAVEEVLRLDPPVLLTARQAAKDTKIAGRRINSGTLVTTLLAGANRDPKVFAEPERFDVARANARDHQSFSSGRHHCLGATLARMEGEVGLRMLFERFPDLAVVPGARRRSTRILRGFSRLPVRLEPASISQEEGVRRTVLG